MMETFKWVTILVLMLAALTISFKTLELRESLIIFLFGHIMMLFAMIKQRDNQLIVVNIFWIIIDIIGIINN